MSKIGKILLYLALVGAVAALIAGGFLIQKRWNDAENLKLVQQQKDAADKKAAASAQEAAAAKTAEEDVTAKLTTANSTIDDQNDKLKAATAAVAQDQAAVITANAATKTAQDALDKIKAVFGDKTPEEIIAAEAKAESDLAASKSEQKILQDQLQSSEKQVADLKDAINRTGPGTMPPGISGKVTFVNRPWNFVVLDVGLANGVVPNGELIIYRGKDFLGKVKVTSVEANSAVADILPDVKGNIQVGDYVIN